MQRNLSPIWVDTHINQTTLLVPISDVYLLTTNGFELHQYQPTLSLQVIIYDWLIFLTRTDKGWKIIKLTMNKLLTTFVQPASTTKEVSQPSPTPLL